MKTTSAKTTVLFLTGLLVATSATADWQCRVHNAKNQAWLGKAYTRSGASAVAMKFCVRGSTYASNCVVDYCQPTTSYTSNVPAAGTWQCNATNARSELWVGTGYTRAVASANAIGFCAAHSTYSRNCYIKQCFVK